MFVARGGALSAALWPPDSGVMITQVFHPAAPGRPNNSIKLTASQRGSHSLTRVVSAVRRGSLFRALGAHLCMPDWGLDYEHYAS